MNPLPEGGILTKLLQIFVFNFAGAAGRLTPDAQWLLALFFSIELIIAGIWFALRRELDVPLLVTKTLTATIFGWLILNWVPLTKMLMMGFLGAGLKAGGDVITERDFTNPDRILAYGFSTTSFLFNSLTVFSVTSPKTLAVALLSGLLAMAAMGFYIFMAIIVFLSLLEFYGALALSLLLLPFGMLQYTRWLAEKAIAHLFAGCIRVGAIAFVLAVAFPVMVTATWGSQDTLAAAFYTLATAGALCGVAWCLDRWVRSLLNASIAFGLQDVSRAHQTLVRQLTVVGSVLQTALDVMAHSDADHPSRNQTTARRGP